MDLRIRPARPDDHAAYARLFPELGVDDPLWSVEKFTADMAPTMLVAEEGGRVLAYVFFQVLSALGYVRHLAVEPAARRRGIGRALMQATATRFRDAGATAWCLNVKPDNEPAIRLYEGMGMARTYRSSALRMPWSALATAASDGGVAARTVAPSDDARLEAALGIVPGMLADARTKQGRVLAWLAEGDEPAALAVFDPAFPGAFPFRARTAPHAIAMLNALRPHARPSDDEIHFVVEDRPDLVEALVALGAVVKLDVLNLKGPLPAVT